MLVKGLEHMIPKLLIEFQNSSEVIDCMYVCALFNCVQQMFWQNRWLTSRVKKLVSPRVIHRIRWRDSRWDTCRDYLRHRVSPRVLPRVSDRILCMTLSETFSETRFFYAGFRSILFIMPYYFCYSESGSRPISLSPGFHPEFRFCSYITPKFVEINVFEKWKSHLIPNPPSSETSLKRKFHGNHFIIEASEAL